MKEFECISCGCCCKRIKNAPMFDPLMIKEDGSCKKLLPNGECSIYEDRPEVCRTNEYYKNHIKSIEGTTLKEWQEMNHYACRTMIGMDYGDQHRLYDQMTKILDDYD